MTAFCISNDFINNTTPDTIFTVIVTIFIFVVGLIFTWAQKKLAQIIERNHLIFQVSLEYKHSNTPRNS